MFKKLEPAFDWSGTKQLTADAGTVKGEKKLMFKCECGGYVVWVKSKKPKKIILQIVLNTQPMMRQNLIGMRHFRHILKLAINKHQCEKN